MNRNVKLIGLRLLLCGVFAVTFGFDYSESLAGEGDLAQATFYVY